MFLLDNVSLSPLAKEGLESLKCWLPGHSWKLWTHTKGEAALETGWDIVEGHAGEVMLHDTASSPRVYVCGSIADEAIVAHAHSAHWTVLRLGDPTSTSQVRAHFAKFMVKWAGVAYAQVAAGQALAAEPSPPLIMPNPALDTEQPPPSTSTLEAAAEPVPGQDLLRMKIAHSIGSSAGSGAGIVGVTAVQASSSAGSGVGIGPDAAPAVALAARDPTSATLCVVAVVVKRSREGDLCARGLVHMYAAGGVMYVPWEPSLALEEQVQPDVLLIKATDFIEDSAAAGPKAVGDLVCDEDVDAPKKEAGDSGGALGKGAVPGVSAGAGASEPAVKFSQSIREVARYAAANSIPCVDALDSVTLVADRRLTRGAVADIEVATGGQVRLSRCAVAETCAQLYALDVGDLLGGDALLVKPAAACGPTSSHEMALVTAAPALRTLGALPPVVVEAFHNHGGVQFKCYVLGERVYTHIKASIPDALPCPAADDSVDAASEGDESCSFMLLGGAPYACAPADVLRFHSLTSMPKAPVSALADVAPPPDAVLHACRRALADRLGLRIFGFDLIRPLTAGAGVAPYVLIDVNAFPSFKGVPEIGDDLRCFLAALFRCSE